MNAKKLPSILLHLVSLAILFYLVKIGDDPVFDKLSISSAIFIELNLLRILQEQV